VAPLLAGPGPHRPSFSNRLPRPSHLPSPSPHRDRLSENARRICRGYLTDPPWWRCPLGLPRSCPFQPSLLARPLLASPRPRRPPCISRSPRSRHRHRSQPYRFSAREGDVAEWDSCPPGLNMMVTEIFSIFHSRVTQQTPPLWDPGPKISNRFSAGQAAEDMRMSSPGCTQTLAPGWHYKCITHFLRGVFDRGKVIQTGKVGQKKPTTPLEIP
jgi:hypothetical protein